MKIPTVNLKKYLPSVTWKDESEVVRNLRADLTETLGFLNESININRGLNSLIGQLVQQNDAYKSEAISTLVAITMQHGGELRVSPEFFESQFQDGRAILALKVDKLEDGTLLLNVVDVEETTEEEEVEPETDEEQEQNEL